MKNLSAFLILVVMSFMLVRICAAAQEDAFSFGVDPQTASRGDTVAVKLVLGQKTPVAAFRVRIGFDASRFAYEGSDPSAAVESGTLRTNCGDGELCAVYVCNAGNNGAPELSGTVVSFRFLVTGETAGTAGFSAQADETCDYAGDDLGLDASRELAVDIVSPSAPKEPLEELAPSSGVLSPAFSPDVLSYTLRVDAATGSVVFQTQAAESGAQVKASRTSLLAAGKETPILLTVTSASGDRKTDYLVTVVRGEPSSSSSPEETKNSSVSSGTNSSGTKTRGGSSEKSGSSSASSRKSSSSARQSAASGTSSAAQSQALVAAAAAPITIQKDNFPAWLVYCLGAGFCVAVGVIVGLLAGRRKPK